MFILPKKCLLVYFETNYTAPSSGLHPMICLAFVINLYACSRQSLPKELV